MAHKFRMPVVSLLALGIAMPAMAQTPQQTQPAPAPAPQTAPAERETTRETVIITANKREESVQDIAVAVTAITSQLRDEIGLTTVQDYTNFAPGLTYSTAGDRLGMRGVTRTSNNFGIRSGISNYVDGVYFSSAIPASREPIFTERVEVVRGPQGTLYGRDSIGGALNVISKRPSNQFETQFNLGYGNYDSTKVEARVTGPITDWLRYSVSGSRVKQGEGYFTNYSGQESEGGRNDGYYVEGQLEGDIGENFEWWTRLGSLQWHREGAPGARTGVSSPDPYDTRAIVLQSTADIGPNAWFGLQDPNRIQVGGQNTNPSITDRYGFNTDFTAFAHLSPTTEFAGEAIYHAPGFDIKYLGGYVYYHYDLQQDNDGSPIKQYNTSPTKTIYAERVSDYIENRGWFSNEINLISTWDGPLQLVGGLYQYQENYNQLVFTSNVTNPGGPIYDIGALQTWLNLGGPINPLVPRPASLVELPTANGRNAYSGSPIKDASLIFFTNNSALNNAYGAFIQGDYEINDQFKITAGIRWSQDQQKGREYARIVNHYVVEAALEAGYSPVYGAANAQALIPVRIDVTSTLGGIDPATGAVGRGVKNATTANPLGIYLDPITGNRYRDMEAKWEEVTGVLGLDWTPDTDTLIYGKYNRGYKPGGLGAAEVFGVLAPTPYTDKELVDAFELGFKKEWRSLNLTTNAVAFYYDYKGYQVSNQVVPEDPDGDGPQVRPNPYTAYVNLPKTETTGFELETIWNPIDDLRFMLNYGWTNPEIKESPALVHSLDPYAYDPAAQRVGTPACTPVATCIGVRGQSLAGNILPFSPKNKIAFNTTYTFNFEGGSRLDASASYFWQDISYSSIFNRSYTKVPSWDQTDARLMWTNADGNLSIIGFMRNVFDDIAYDNRGAGLREATAPPATIPGSAVGTGRVVAPTQCFTSPQTTAAFGARPANSCYTISETLRPPRTYGIELQLRF